MQWQFSFLVMAVAIVVTANIFALKPIDVSDTGFDKMFDAVPAEAPVDTAALDLASIETAAGDETPGAPEQKSEPVTTSEKTPPVTTESEPGKPTTYPDAMAAATAGKDSAAAPACKSSLSPDLLTGFYQSQSVPITKDADGLKVATTAGTVSIGGVQYKLKYVELPKVPAIPISSVSYPLEVRFVHENADGKTLVVSIPLKEGAANPAFESLLQAKEQVAFDPNELMPTDRRYAVFQTGKDCTPENILLPKPVEVSAAQIEKFKALF